MPSSILLAVLPAVVGVMLVCGASTAAESLWWSPKWRHRREVQLRQREGEWFQLPVPDGVPLDSMQFVAQPAMEPLTHSVQTVEIAEARPIADDPKVHYGFPRLIRAADGRLLLFYRVGVSHAQDPAAIGMRTSLDVGQTWSAEQILHKDPDGYCAHNPVAAVAPDGRLLLFVSRYDWQANRRLHMLWSHSDDHGETWAPFAQFDTDASRSSYYMTDVITTPRGMFGGSATFAASGVGSPHDLIWHSLDGRQWQVLSRLTEPSANRGDEVAFLGTGDGRFDLMLRDRRRCATYRFRSTDAGRTWGPEEDLGHMVEILQRPFYTRLTEDVVLLSGRDCKRRLVVVFVSRDGGKTFGERHVIDSYTADGAYTSAVRLTDSRALMVYYADTPTTRGKPDVKQVTLTVLDRPKRILFRVPKSLSEQARVYLYFDAEHKVRTPATSPPIPACSEASLDPEVEHREQIPLAEPKVWRGEYTGDCLPDQCSTPWTVVKHGRASLKLDDGALRICDAGDQAGEMVFCASEWELKPGYRAVIDVCLRAISCTSKGGVMLLVANGDREEVFTFFPDRIHTNRSNLTHAIDLASDFVTLRIIVEDEDFVVEHGGRPVLDGPGRFVAHAHDGRRVIQFGSRSSAAKGEALWRLVRYKVRATW